MQVKVPFLHSGQMLDDLTRKIPLFPQTPQPVPAGPELLEHHRKRFTPSGQRPVGILPVAPQVDAHHAAVRVFLKEAPDAVGEIFPADPAGPGAPPLGKDHEVLPPAQQMIAFLDGAAHLLRGAAPSHRYALRQIAQYRQ
jgi:hypothetical protein